MDSSRSPRLIYSLEDKPPLPHLILIGLQYTCMLFPYLIIVVILEKKQGIVSSNPISFSLIALGISTLLQAIKKGPLGSGYLAPPVISAIYFPASMTAVIQGGMSLVYGMTLVAGGVEIIFSFAIKMLRKLFPPLVCGLIIMAVAFQLGLLAISQTLAIDLWNSPFYLRHVAASIATLFTMMGLTIWASGMWRLLSPFIGILVGFILSFFLQIIPNFESFKEAAWVALPSFNGIGYSFSWDLLFPFALAAIASSLRVIGGVTTCQRINDPAWFRPDLKNIKKGIIADGIGCFLGGILGVPGMNMAPSLVGVSQATGATSRVIAISLAVWLFVLSLLPKLIYLFLSIPLSVMGAALLFTASFMLAGGIELITVRKMDTRSLLVIGISILLGISQPVFSSFYKHLPLTFEMFTDSLLSVVTISAFVLNLVLRLGVRQKVTMHKIPETLEELEQQIATKLKEWEISSSIKQRIQQSCFALCKTLEIGYLKEGDAKVDLVFDPVELLLRFRYHGTIPNLRFDPDKERELLEETSFTQGFANYSFDVSADKIKTSTKDAECQIDLYFHI